MQENCNTTTTLPDQSADNNYKNPLFSETSDGEVLESADFLLPYLTYKVKLEVDVMLIGLTFLAAITRFYNLCHPRNVM